MTQTSGVGSRDDLYERTADRTESEVTRPSRSEEAMAATEDTRIRELVPFRVRTADGTPMIYAIGKEAQIYE